MNIDSIITEWTYRLPKGYPTTESDYTILHDVLSEMTTFNEQERNAIVNKARGIAEQETEVEPQSIESTDTSIIEKIQSIGLSEDVNNQILQVYNSLSESEKQDFNKNFRAHSIESYISSGYKAFDKFFLVNVGGARGGMGNGEISILLGVADSKPGGTAQHDIVMPSGEWEVKELKSSKFDPAQEGLVSKFKLTKEIQNFYTSIVQPVSNIGDPYTQLKHLIDPASHDDLKRLIMIFETRFSEAIDPDKLQSYEWKKSAMNNWYEGFKELNKIFYKSDLDSDVRDTRMTISHDGNEESFWIDDDDVQDIRSAAGTEKTADIWVGEPVNDVNNNAIIWFKRIENSPFIKNPEYFIHQLTNIKTAFFNNILGLIWYNYRNPVPNIGNPEDFAIDTASQGRYRFVLKNISANNGYEYIQKQS